MDPLQSEIDREAEATRFSGVVRIDREGGRVLEAAYGLADRAHGIPMTPAHQLGTASVTKGFTAVAVMALVADGLLELTTSARSVLGRDLPLIADDVTVEHLLSHRSGIGDYLDESALESASDYVMPVPVHRLARTEDYLEILDGHPAVAPAGSTFAYNNGAFVVLALIAERVAGTEFHALVEERVWRPAGMTSTAFWRTDALPGTVAVGYLEAEGLATNVLHLPVRGSGDGGAYTTVGDLSAFWPAFVGGRIVPSRWVEEMLVPRQQPAPGSLGCGLGVWLHSNGVLDLHGYDAGVSFRTLHEPATSSTWTVGASTSSGSYPIERILLADLAPDARSSRAPHPGNP